MVWTVQHGCGWLAKAANTAKGQHPCGFPRGEGLAKGWRMSADRLRAGFLAVAVYCGRDAPEARRTRSGTGRLGWHGLDRDRGSQAVLVGSDVASATREQIAAGAAMPLRPV